MQRDEDDNIEFKASINIVDLNGCQTEYLTTLTVFVYYPGNYIPGQGDDVGEGKETLENDMHWLPFDDEEVATVIPWTELGTYPDLYITTMTPTPPPGTDREVSYTVAAAAGRLVYFQVILECTMTPGTAEIDDINPNTDALIVSYVYIESNADVTIVVP